MDEADIIADRKLILKKGSIRCLGSSVYLKKHFQMRYSLEVETNEPQAVEKLVKYYIPEAEYYNEKTKVEENELLPSNSISNHTWKLAIDSSPLFSYLIKHLEEEKRKGNILSNFSVSAPRLEELFVQLNRENESSPKNEVNTQKENESTNSHSENNTNNDESTDCLTENNGKDDESTDNTTEDNTKDDELIDSKDDFTEFIGRTLKKKPNDFMIALRMVKYRFMLRYRGLLYIGVTIVLPLIVTSIYFIELMGEYKPVKSSDFEKHEISSNMYSDQKWNFDIDNSQSIDNIQKFSEILQQGSTGLKNIVYQSNDNLNSDIFNKNKTNLFANKPYYVSSFSGELTNNIYNFSIYYNDSMPHSLPSLLNSLSNAIISKSAPFTNTTITVNSYPLLHYDTHIFLTSQNYVLMISMSFCLSFYLFFCGSNVVKERTRNHLKQYQLNGISNFSYWFSLFICDYIWIIFSCITVFMSIVLFKYVALYQAKVILLLTLLFLISSIPCILFQYVLSFLFTNENVAILSFFFINLVPNILIIIFNKELVIYGKRNSLEHFLISIFINTILPCFGFVSIIRDCISIGMKYITFKIINITWNDIFLKIPSKNLSHIVGAGLSTVLYTEILVYIIKKKYTQNKKNVYKISKEMKNDFEKEMELQDEDVYYEYKRVKVDVNTNEIPIKLVNLVKEYDIPKFYCPKKSEESMKCIRAKYGEYHTSIIKHKKRPVITAIENVNLGINKYECFGLLGPNGSGKTSLLNILSLTNNQTVGDVFYEGKNILDRQSNEITIGYCPQENALWEELTLSEHIEMFLFIRGFSRKESKRLTKHVINYCGLRSHRNKFPSELSGGTRRKLNILIALCCDSPCILLDEPSTGIDPVSRHLIWNVIKATIKRNQSSLILTTHYLEEAELLCNRIGIIINGKLKCIGTPEHLKMKYGHTYILDVNTENIERFHKEVVVAFNLFGNNHSYKRTDISQQRVKYEIQYTNTSDISRVFEIMEACRDIYVDEQYLYIDYSYSQTNLEEVYINFARIKENSINNDDSLDDTIIV